MYEPYRPYPFAALLVLCLAFCADPALAGATGGWGEGAGPAQPDNPNQGGQPPQKIKGFFYKDVCYSSVEIACAAFKLEFGNEKVGGWTNVKLVDAYCRVEGDVGRYKGHLQGTVSGRTVGGHEAYARQMSFIRCDYTPPEPPKSGGGGDFGGGGASGDWEEDPKKPDEDKEDPKEEPKDPDPDFGDLGDIPKPPVPPASEPPGVKPPSGGGGVAINIPEPCTGAAAGTVGCMKPGTPSGEVPKPQKVDAGKDVGTRPVSNIKGCPDPRTFDFWGERYELSYDMLCEKAPIVKSFVMFSSSLSGFLMMLSVFRRK